MVDGLEETTKKQGLNVKKDLCHFESPLLLQTAQKINKVNKGQKET